jgi:succinate dehydrogenase / fumarate reductase flavoprotein subunit
MQEHVSDFMQDVMQDLVGIVRQEQEMLQALDRIQELRAASERVSVDGNREYNAGWHTALDLHNLLTVSEIVTRAALDRKESRGAHFRDDFPSKDEQQGSSNVVVRKGTDGQVQLVREPIRPMREDLQQIIQEMK